jgi:carotenoid 1,2-hydratase
LRLDSPVPSGGYAWWYVDGLSDDGRHAITLIAFVGSVFSPYYAWARRRGAPLAEDHCALNVALYGAGRRGWACTERGRGAIARSAARYEIGRSAISWDGNALTIDIDEVACPLPRRLHGRVRLHPRALPGRSFALDAAGRHRWHPVAPSARIEVEMTSPALRWSGAGYFDSNDGDEPLERAFSSWTWSRASHGGDAVILYDAERRTGGPLNLALRFDARGGMREIPAPPVARLPTSLWRVPRATRSQDGRAGVIDTLEDGPFYARSLVSTRLDGAEIRAMHESLSLDRFAAPWVQALLPFRMPRRA